MTDPTRDDPMPTPPPATAPAAAAPMERSKLVNYNSERGANAYKADYANKLHRKVSDRRERRIFARWFAELGPFDSLLDVPCGAGRLYGLFQQHARAVYEADWSFTMVALDRADHDAAAAGYLRASALEIPLADASVEAVASVRLSHHLVDERDRERHLRELFRVSARVVVATWFSATSLKNRLRRLRAPFDKKKPKNTLHTRRVEAIAHECGFDMRAAAPLSRIGSGHVFGLFVRR